MRSHPFGKHEKNIAGKILELNGSKWENPHCYVGLATYIVELHIQVWNGPVVLEQMDVRMETDGKDVGWG